MVFLYSLTRVAQLKMFVFFFFLGGALSYSCQVRRDKLNILPFLYNFYL